MRLPTSREVTRLGVGVAFTAAAALTGCDYPPEDPGLTVATIGAQESTKQSPPDVIFGLYVPDVGVTALKPTTFNCDVAKPENARPYVACFEGTPYKPIVGSVAVSYCIPGANGIPELMTNEVKPKGENDKPLPSKEAFLASAVRDTTVIEPVTGIACVVEHGFTQEAATAFQTDGFALTIKARW